MQNYVPQSNYKKQIYDDITQAIAENNVIELPDLICQESEVFVCPDLNADLETEDKEPIQGFQSWVELDEQQRKYLNHCNNENIVINGD